MNLPLLPSFLALAVLTGLTACRPPSSPANPAATADPEVLLRVGSQVVTEADLAHALQHDHHSRTDPATRERALTDLARRTRFAQAALDAGLADDPIVRAEYARLLASRLRETVLMPQLAATRDIPASRLRELYHQQLATFQAPEQRHVAVLWLDSGSDPARQSRAAEKLAQARTFATQNRDLLDHPAKGFAILAPDFSDHSATKFRGGVLGWLTAKVDSDPWTRVVTQASFSLDQIGALSDVLTTPEGTFLVRLLALRPARTRSFESVAPEIAQAERTRLYNAVTTSFEAELAAVHPLH